MSTPSPAQVRQPGYFLKQLLERRGWTQNDLAEILGRPPRLVSEIILGKRSITPETAKGLGAAFKTGAEVWMNLEASYQLFKAAPTDEGISRRAEVFGRFPVREMQKRGWLPHSANLREIEKHLASFLGVGSLQEDLVPNHAAKKTGYDKPSSEQIVWLSRAKHLAPKLSVARYSPGNLAALIKELRACVENADDAAKVPGLLADAGIRFLVIQPLPSSKIDAACMWPDDIPLIAMTLRYDRHDIFWHALFHELDHIRHEEGQGDPIVETNMMSSCSAGIEIERRANASAAATLIPPPELERLIQTVTYTYSEATILSFAHRLNVHPGIVVGQLQHRGQVPWSAFSRLRAKVRGTLIETAYTDGFGRS